MKYYKILDPKNLSLEERNSSVYIAWKDIFDSCNEKKIEGDLDFLYYLLTNIPALCNSGELVEKTVLLAMPIDKEEFEDSIIQLSISNNLSICYNI